MEAIMRTEVLTGRVSRGEKRHARMRAELEHFVKPREGRCPGLRFCRVQAEAITKD